MHKLFARARKSLVRAAGLLGLALFLALVGAFVSHDGRGAERFYVALLVLSFVGGTVVLLGRLAGKAVRRGVRGQSGLSIRPARIAIGVGAPLALGFGYLTLIAASDPLPGALVFLGALLWFFIGAERSGSRARRLVTHLGRGWRRPAAAYELAAQLVTVGVVGNLLVLVLWAL